MKCPRCKIKLESSMMDGLTYFCPKCKFKHVVNPYIKKERN